jgi:DivIVA domain-containing protein
MMILGPDEVRGVVFGRASILRRGYDEAAVDALLDRLEATLRGLDDLSPEEVDGTRFCRVRFGRRGYSTRAVDSFLERAETALRRRRRRVERGQPA